MLLLLLASLALFPGDVQGLVIYRIGTPFSASERDSLERTGIDFREISWSASQLQSDLSLDSLHAGSLQPHYFGADVNIAETLLSRGGWVRVFLFASENANVGQVLIDGDPTTSYTWDAIDPEQFANTTFGWAREKQPETVTLDLGGEFLVKEVRIRPLKSRPEHYLEEFGIGVSEEYRTTSRGAGTGSAFFDPILEMAENDDPDIRAFLDPPVETRFMQLQIPRVTPKELGIAELEVFGGGFVSHASYESDVIEMGDIASWGEITWSGKRAADARIDIRTRSGDDAHPEIFWQARLEQQDIVKYLEGDGDLSMTEYRRQYDRLSEFLKPEEPKDRASPDTENWSFWSSAYEFGNPGTDIVSPGPRKYFQIRTDFHSTLEDGGKIDFIEFRASVPPAVRRLVGEIHPVDTVVGEITQFTYYLRPTIRSGDKSFDGISISAPSGVVSVDSLRVDGIDRDFTWTRRADGQGFELLLPRKLEPADSGALVEVVFAAPVLREVGTLFAARVFDTSNPQEVRQRVIPGNAADEIESDRLSVTTSLGRYLVHAFQVRPNPFTPNGDEVNDLVNISYKLLRITSPVPVSIRIFDLSGRLVRVLYAGDDLIGEYNHTWDGTDGRNRLVPPGLYLVRIVADIQSRVETNSRVVSVAY